MHESLDYPRAPLKAACLSDGLQQKGTRIDEKILFRVYFRVRSALGRPVVVWIWLVTMKLFHWSRNVKSEKFQIFFKSFYLSD